MRFSAPEAKTDRKHDYLRHGRGGNFRTTGGACGAGTGEENHDRLCGRREGA
jgi:hypothetical protein